MDEGPGRRPDAAVRLGSRRQLGFAEWGDPWGVPVLFFHGTPGSRRLAFSNDAVARELGVRLICVERPGFGLSAPQPDRTLLDWPSDVAEFADILGLGRFAVVGMAAGGPYALACGHRLPGRLTGVGVIAGFVPPQMYPGDELVLLIRQDPDRARRIIRSNLETMAGELEATVASLPAERGGHDRQVYARPEVQAQLLAAGREALRSGIDGMVTDVWLLNSPWGFAVADVPTRTHWWHGDEDRLTPLPAVERIVSPLPRGTLTIHRGEGHAIAFDHGDEILATVARWA